MNTIINMMNNLGLKLDFRLDRRSEIIKLLKEDGKPIVIYGSGKFARSVAEKCLTSGLEVLCFLDQKEYWYEKKELTVGNKRIRCLTKELLVEEKNYNVLSGYIDYSMLEVLKRDFKYCKIVEYLDVYESHIMPYDYLVEHSKILYELYDDLKDNESRNVLMAYLYSRVTGDVRILSDLNHNPQFMYDWELLDVGVDDVVVDGGAFTGDTIDEIISVCGDVPRHVWAFEPDTQNMIKLLKHFSPERLAKIHTILAGLYSEDMQLSFSASGTLGAKISENGNERVSVQSLDFHDAYENVTVIKMDIEGSELAALHGAQHLLSNNHPRLAICIYHNNDDIIHIYNYLKQFNYSFYLRQHSYSVEETVLYAI